MTWFELGVRINHFFTAKHYRGHGIHSPYLYDFVRNVLVTTKNQDLVQRIEEKYLPHKTIFINSLDNIDKEAYIAILARPFRSKNHYRKWIAWRKKHPCTSVHLKNFVILFFDNKLQNQHFKIRS